MVKDEWDDVDISRASMALDEELDKIFRETGGLSGTNEPFLDDEIPDAELLDDDDLDISVEPPEAEIIDGGEDDLTMPGPITREELAAIIEQSVERGILAALKKLGKI